MVDYYIFSIILVLILLFFVVYGAICLIMPEAYYYFGQYFTPQYYLAKFNTDCNFTALAPLYSELQSMFYISFIGLAITLIIIMIKPKNYYTKFACNYSFRAMFVINFIIIAGYLVYAGFKYNELYDAFATYENLTDFWSSIKKYSGIYVWYLHPVCVHALLMAGIYYFIADQYEFDINGFEPIIIIFYTLVHMLLYPVLFGLVSNLGLINIIFDLISTAVLIFAFVTYFKISSHSKHHFIDNMWED